MRINMECKKMEQLIKLYIDENIDLESLQTLLQHMDTCRSCRDELEIGFLVKEGLQSLEEGETFDLTKELQRKLEHSRKVLAIIDKIRISIYILEMMAGIVLVVCTAILFSFL